MILWQLLISSELRLQRTPSKAPASSHPFLYVETVARAFAAKVMRMRRVTRPKALLRSHLRYAS